VSGDPHNDPGLAEGVRARGSALLDALERHLPGSRDHADGTASYAFATAVELDLGRTRAEAVRETARLHEVGKVYVPAGVLARSRTQLGPGDQALLDSHPAYGAQLAQGAGVPEEACDWILATRASFDGSGPIRLAGEDIPLESRIIRVACACEETLAAPGAGSAAELQRRAIDRLRDAAAGDLDPRVVDALAGILERAATPRS
jgi:HD-GYP domain-containing protein (c-di-GMP phosphodiesterase class II)